MDSVARLLSMNSNCRPLLTSCRPLLTSFNGLSKISISLTYSGVLVVNDYADNILSLQTRTSIFVVLWLTLKEQAGRKKYLDLLSYLIRGHLRPKGKSSVSA